jgi:hypothetical protein
MRVVRSTFDSSRVHRRAATARRRLTSRPPRETPRGVAGRRARYRAHNPRCCTSSIHPSVVDGRRRRRASATDRDRRRWRASATSPIARVRDVAETRARANERTNERTNERMTFRVVEDAIVVRETRDARARGRRRRRSPKPEVRRKSSPVASPIASLVRRRPRATTPSPTRVRRPAHHDGGDIDDREATTATATIARRRRRRRGRWKEGRSRCRTRATTRRRTRRWRTG